MKSTNFELVNPYIEGNFKKIFASDNNLKAAKKCYKNLSKYIRNPMPKFHFSLKNMKSGKYLHFVVKEKMQDNKELDISYSIKQIKVTNNEKEIEKFENKLESLKLKDGGKLFDDFDDSDDFLDSDSEYYDRYRYRYPYRIDQPIHYYYYDPLVYKVDRFYLPHFVLPLLPLVEVSLSSAFFGY